jgi:hypothetical protein
VPAINQRAGATYCNNEWLAISRPECSLTRACLPSVRTIKRETVGSLLYGSLLAPVYTIGSLFFFFLIMRSSLAVVHRRRPLIRLPATRTVLLPIFCLRAPVLFFLPCDLQDASHDAGSAEAGLLHTPRGCWSYVLGSRMSMISVIRMCVFTPSLVDVA